MGFEKEEKFKRLVDKYPIGSKLAAHLVDYDSLLKLMDLKVYGYSKCSEFILVYNPEIRGHDGINRAYDADGISLDREILSAKYGKHFWFVAENHILEK